MEKRGVPVATIASEEFASLGKAQLKMLGRPNLPLIRVPHPIGGQPKAKVEEFADNIVEEVVGVLTVRSTQKPKAVG